MRLNNVIFVFACLTPLAWYGYLLAQGELGAQPAEELNHRLGDMTLRLLALNLIWGALLALNLLPRVARRFTYLRRHLGVVTFVYALLHVAFYVLKEGDLDLAVNQLFTKTYLLVGLSAFSVLGLLAITSNNLSVRWLKTKWKSLHRLAYVAMILVVIHFALIEKKDWTVSLPFLLPLLALQGLRVLKLVQPTQGRGARR